MTTTLRSPPSRSFTWARIAALLVSIVLLTGLTYLRVSSSSAAISVPQGAHAGQLTMQPCTYPTENGAYRADCGTLVVPEDRADPRSRLIALPVTRILARSSHPLAPIFHLNGGPGITNMTFPQANRLAAQHDVVMVGYRGVDGSSVLNCPEVTAALENSADFLGKASLSAYTQAFASCAQRLERSGVDLAGYTLEEQADDIEAARVALGYQRIDLLSESAGTRLGMIYSWMYPNSVDRSVMIGVNPPGNFVYSGAEIDQGIERYSALCAQQPACRARTGNLAASMQHTAAHIPSRWYFLPIKPGNVLVGTFLGLTESTSEASPLSGPMTLDSWISAAQGNPSGLWLLSEMAGLILPTSFVWGELASIAMTDAQPAERYFSSGADRGSIIGNPLAELLWGAGGLVHAWPANPGENQYTSVQNSNVPTLLIGGTLDFETPVVLGLGGFFGAALVVLTLWPALSLASELLRILAPSGLIALGLYLAWTHRDWDRATKSLGLLAAIAGALLGGWLGFTAVSGLFALVTTTIGAAAAGNLALIAVSLFRERSARGHGNDSAATYAVAPAPGSPAVTLHQAGAAPTS